ncbi:hypothetical protein SDC9_179520 [bioreactor metagenome]|uniref:Uncharacterized protein n=1 Tax=bioreactor metagenome TaxID=1076179 RepID=A0A645H6Y9_9ZZZZ
MAMVSQPISEAITLASSAAGISAVPADITPTTPPVRGAGVPLWITTVRARLFHSSLSGLKAFRKTSRCGGVTRVIRALLLSPAIILAISTTSSGSLQSARIASITPVLLFLWESSFAIFE